MGTEPVGVQCISYNHFPCVCLVPVGSICARLFDTNPLCHPSILCMVFLASRFPPSSPSWRLWFLCNFSFWDSECLTASSLAPLKLNSYGLIMFIGDRRCCWPVMVAETFPSATFLGWSWLSFLGVKIYHEGKNSVSLTHQPAHLYQ